jgi:hypothetical protein
MILSLFFNSNNTTTVQLQKKTRDDHHRGLRLKSLVLLEPPSREWGSTGNACEPGHSGPSLPRLNMLF